MLPTTTRKSGPVPLKLGHLSLKKVFENIADKSTEKVQANCKGPYIVSKANKTEAYHLKILDGTLLLRL